MLRGFETFKNWFSGCEDKYIIIGGTACNLLFSEASLPFRATKDIDIVLIVEALDQEFVLRFFEFVKAGGYRHVKGTPPKTQFYRFDHPSNPEYPSMIELFAKKPEALVIPEGVNVAPLSKDDEASSLSAILLNEDYYNFILGGKSLHDGVSLLGPEYLIPLKIKAWIDISMQQEESKSAKQNARKHLNDIIDLTQLLSASKEIDLPNAIKEEVIFFVENAVKEISPYKPMPRHKNIKEALSKIRKTYKIR